MATSAQFITEYKTKTVQLDNADGTSDISALALSGTFGRIHSISVVNTSGTGYSLVTKVSDGTTTVPVATTSIPANAGNTAGTPAVSILDEAVIPALDASPGRFLTLGDGASIIFALSSGLASGHTLEIVISYGEY